MKIEMGIILIAATITMACSIVVLFLLSICRYF